VGELLGNSASYTPPAARQEPRSFPHKAEAPESKLSINKGAADPLPARSNRLKTIKAKAMVNFIPFFMAPLPEYF
jgi:hypothetical protein